MIFGEDHEGEYDELSYSPANSKKTTSLESRHVTPYGDTPQSESDMQESSVFIHGSTTPLQVKIVDKSKRAFEISNEST